MIIENDGPREVRQADRIGTDPPVPDQAERTRAQILAELRALLDELERTP